MPISNTDPNPNQPTFHGGTGSGTDSDSNCFCAQIDKLRFSGAYPTVGIAAVTDWGSSSGLDISSSKMALGTAGVLHGFGARSKVGHNAGDSPLLTSQVRMSW